MSRPILYSLRRCPYAMRARIALLLARQTVRLRDVVMKHIPAELLAASPKGTVPVLVFEDSRVIDESLDIMLWALQQNDPNDLLNSKQPGALASMLAKIKRYDMDFVDALEKYKTAARYHDSAEKTYRQQCEKLISPLEQSLDKYDYLMGARPSLADYALLPFLRQFSRVDRKWFINAPYPNLHRWLNTHYQNPIYSIAMTQYPQWADSHQEFLFGGG
ncbi:glutathione S-transferase [Photobacterium alginatilyticum]|uniref:Glutathione S-transferase n=1 Tax=Photobacterium alginatilyticum TaxID=1775171 RepID=A0ABW9YNT8_9GAMM|nr:glutathione S-transferase [Photobacterium alginatilyticum]NBI54709.1 glutathione S-transferase [Photobacterium alginatilyticum]